MKRLRLLGLSGSLRLTSYNTAALQAMSRIAPVDIELTVFQRLAEIPPFNPDLDGEGGPALEELRDLLGRADGLIVASPEYAHGVSGVLKNVLDWLVAGEEFVYKPVMLINTSPRAHHALDALAEVLRTMSGNLIDEANVAVPLLGSGLDVGGIVGDKEISERLLSALASFRRGISALESRP